jgi:hypothetical protein
MSEVQQTAPLDVADEDILLMQEVHEEDVLPVWDPTGQPLVDEALELLQSLSGDVNEHASVYDEVHRRLRDSLASQES